MRKPLLMLLSAVTLLCVTLMILPDDSAASTWSVREAQRNAFHVLVKITPGCERQGLHAEAWAEANTAMPHGYEIVGHCVSR
jgi:hypothetical protein